MENYIIKYYDVSNLFEKWDVFQNLVNIPNLFEQVKVEQEDLEFLGMMKLIYLAKNYGKMVIFKILNPIKYK